MKLSTQPDIRWRDVYARIKPVRTPFTAKGPGVVVGFVVTIEVRWDGELFTSRLNLTVNDFPHRYQALAEMVEGIDDLMIERGYLPYEIRSE